MLITKTNPVGIDSKIQKLQTSLHTYLVRKWGLSDDTVYHCHGRAYRNKVKDGYIAEVFTEGKDYAEVYWNDRLSAISFFHKGDNEVNEIGSTKVDVSIIFFINVQKIKAAVSHRADEEIRSDVRRFFGLSNNGFHFTGIETGIDNVLREYPGTRKSEGLKVVDMQPIHAFRVNGTLKFIDNGCSNSSLRLNGSTSGGDTPVGTNPGTTEDLSHFKFTFTVTGDDAFIVVYMNRNSNTEESLIVWGDGDEEVVSAGPILSGGHTYSPGTYVCKVYPINGVTNPQATCVNLIEIITLTKTGDGVVSTVIGGSLTYALFLRWFQAENFGLAAFPDLPQGNFDQMRLIHVKDNSLTGAELSDIMIDMDEIGWTAGEIDFRNNPGVGSYTSEGTAARTSLLNKSWTIYE